MRERIADLVAGILPERQIPTVDEHLIECSACKEYARRLQEEDELLAGLFSKFDGRVKGGQDRVIDSLNGLDTRARGRIFSVVAAAVKSSVTKRAAAAAVIVVVALYFIITLNWISQINLQIDECIRLNESIRACM